MCFDFFSPFLLLLLLFHSLLLMPFFAAHCRDNHVWNLFHRFSFLATAIPHTAFFPSQTKKWNQKKKNKYKESYGLRVWWEQTRQRKMRPPSRPDCLFSVVSFAVWRDTILWFLSLFKCTSICLVVHTENGYDDDIIIHSIELNAFRWEPIKCHHQNRLRVCLGLVCVCVF